MKRATIPELSVKIGGLKLKNPVTVASGTFGYAEEFAPFMDLKKLGAVITKTITLEARQGNSGPRTCETPSGLLNSIGLENPGIRGFVEEKLPFLKKLNIPVIVSIASEGDLGEFTELARILDGYPDVDGMEINISCPNVSGKGRCSLVSQDPELTAEAVRMARKGTDKTLIAKLSPNVSDIGMIARAAEEAGSDAVSLINTLGGMAVDLDSRTPKLGNVFGGLSGPAIKPVAMKMVWEAYRSVKIPIIAMGGIMDHHDALEFILCGASAVCTGTVNFIDPKAAISMIEGIAAYAREQGIKDINLFRGTLKA